MQNLEDKIRRLGNLTIDEDFRANTRDELMARVALNKPAINGNFGFFNIFFKHAYGVVSVGIFIFLLGGTALAMKQAANSLPGDFLYNLKKIGEKAQVGLTLNEARRAEKEVGFAEKRMEEITSLTASVNTTDVNAVNLETGEVQKELMVRRGSPLRPEVIAEAVSEFHRDVNNVSNRLSALKDKENGGAVETAKIINNKAEKIATALSEVAKKQDLPEEVKQRLAAAINILDKVNSEALGVMVKGYTIRGDKVEFESLVKQLEERIARTETALKNVDQIVIGKGMADDQQGVLLSSEKKVELAKIILSEAKEYLANKNLEMALSKMEESKKLAENVKTEIEVDVKGADGSTRLTTGNVDKEGQGAGGSWQRGRGRC